jgi:hypothetical protein
MLVEQLKAIINIKHPSTEHIQRALANLTKEKERLIQLSTEFDKNPEKGKGKGKEKDTAKKNTKRSKDADMPEVKRRRKNTDEAEEVGKKSESKWRQLEEKDLKETVMMKNGEPDEGEKAMSIPKLGRGSRYVDAL